MTTFDPNGDEGAQYIAYTATDTTHTRPVLGWGNPDEGWPHLTPIVGHSGDTLPLPYDPSRTFAYGPTAEGAARILGEKMQASHTRPEENR